MDDVFPVVLWQLGPVAITDTVVVSLALSVLLVVGSVLLRRLERVRAAMEVVYELLEDAVTTMVSANVRPLIPVILTQWLFIGLANLIGLLPVVSSPTRDVSLTAALAVVALGVGHVYAFRANGMAYLKRYIEPHPLLLPFNIIGELSRTLALALRLFGNMMSAELVGAIVVLLAGLLIPVPLMLLSVLTGVVQAYIFGVLTLVFTASSMEAAVNPRSKGKAVGGEAVKSPDSIT